MIVISFVLVLVFLNLLVSFPFLILFVVCPFNARIN